MSEKKVKITSRISKEVHDDIAKLAEEDHAGNFTNALERASKEGIKVIKKQKNKQ